MLRCSETYFYFSTAVFRDIDDIMWVTFCYWMNLEVFIYHAIISASYLVIITCFWLRQLETWFLQDLLPFGIPDHWWMIYFLSLYSKSILVCMHSNHVQNQSNVSAYPAEELRIEPFKWWSPWEGLLINKGALMLSTPHHRMTAHSHYSETNDIFGKKWENYTETSNKNLLLI